MAEKKKISKGLHKFVASGGKPKDYKGSTGINEKTVPGITSKKSNK